MKRAIAVLCTLTICFAFATASAAGKLNVVQEDFHYVESYWNYGYVYAKVENVGDKPIGINAGVFEIYDEAGSAITSSDYLNAYACYLNPGEYTYVEMYAENQDAGVKPCDYMLTVTGKSNNSKTCLRLPCETALELNVSSGWWTYNYMYATVTNNTDQTLYNISVVMALMDADGHILYIDDDCLYDERALTPGSSMVFRKDISSAFMDYFAANGLTPVQVDAIAYVELDVE